MDIPITPVQLASGFCLGLMLFCYTIYNDGNKNIPSSFFCFSSLTCFALSIPFACGLFNLQDMAYIPIFVGLFFFFLLLFHNILYQPISQWRSKRKFKKESERDT